MASDRTTYPFPPSGNAVTSGNTQPANGLLPTTDPFEAAARAFEHICTECGAPASAVLDGRPMCVACKTELTAPAEEEPDGE